MSVPAGATILPMLTVDHKTAEAFAWFDVDIDAGTELRYLVVVGTGESIPEEQGHRTVHVASTVVDGFVWHLFETRAVRSVA